MRDREWCNRCNMVWFSCPCGASGTQIPKPPRGPKALMLLALALCALAACAFDPPESGLAPETDAGVGPGNPPSDAKASAGSYVALPVQCEPFVRTVVHAAADNSREVTTNEWARFPVVTPQTDFIVTICQPSAPGPHCNGGDVCTGAMGPASTVTCQTSRGGPFLDGVLTLQCSSKYERFTANGTLVTSSYVGYSISVEVAQ